MFGKLLLVILTAFVTAAGLLVMRQQRLELAHRASVVHRRLSEQERSLWELQHRIATACRPAFVRERMSTGEHRWVPIPNAPPERRDEAVHVVGQPEPERSGAPGVGG